MKHRLEVALLIQLVLAGCERNKPQHSNETPPQNSLQKTFQDCKEKISQADGEKDALNDVSEGNYSFYAIPLKDETNLPIIFPGILCSPKNFRMYPSIGGLGFDNPPPSINAKLCRDSELNYIIKYNTSLAHHFLDRFHQTCGKRAIISM
jgi:hypothetical protein